MLKSLSPNWPRLALIASFAVAPLAAQAHNVWILPSSTVLSKSETITVDAAVSNDLFVFNYLPLALDNLRVRGPDGKPFPIENPHRGKLRSVFDLTPTQTGTYQLSIINQGLFASYRHQGETKRWRGSVEAFASAIPKEATDVQVTESFGRVESFLTLGKPSIPARDGKGLEMIAITHPNDLVRGEAARFQFLIDGQPAPNLEVSVVRGGTRYRNRQDEITATTDQAGEFSLTWPEAGMYWLESAHTDKKTSLLQAKERRLSYAVTLEVQTQ